MRVVDFLERDARIYPRKPAVVVVGGPSLTYEELRERVGRVAGGIAARGVKQGDRVAVVAHNGLTFFDVYLACAYLGATAVPLSIRLAAPEIRYQLSDCEPSMVIVDSDLEASVSAASPDQQIISTGSDEYASIVAESEPSGLTERASADDAALIIYTSGTTGKPKGACLSQRALTANAVTLSLGQRIVHEDVFMTMTPLYHAATGVRVAANLIDGQTHVVLPDFSVDAALDAIETYRVTTFISVPAQLRRLLDSPSLERRDLSSIRLICYGAAPTVPTLIRRAIAMLPCDFYQGYGLSEATSAVCGLLPSDHRDLAQLDARLTSCGRPLPGVSVRIVDPHGDESVVGEVGEICVRGDNIMTGYWRNEIATAEALRDGWLHTGDLASRDAEGYIHIAGRKKDMLISGGVNVYPSEIEAVLSAHPSVAEAAVIGVPDDEWGEVPVAFIISRSAERLEPDDLRAFCEQRLARLKVPRRYWVVEEFPRTDAGKVKKRDLREDELASTEGGVAWQH